MPCDQVVTTSVDLKHLAVENLDHLTAALEAVGYAVSVSGSRLTARSADHGTLTYDQATGDLRQETRGRQTALDVNAVKVGYSKQVVKTVATRFGWSLTEEKVKAGSPAVVAFTAKKRSF